MFSKGKKKGTIRFAVKPETSVKKVMLAGTFTNWEPVTMRKQKDGSYVRNLELPAGQHEYKFITDGQWRHDTDNNDTVYNEHGSLNSIAKVDSNQSLTV